MDLNDLYPKQDTIEVVLVYKDKTLTNEDGSKMTVEVYLPHTKVSKQVAYTQQNTLMRKREAKEEILAEDWVDLGLERLAGITKSWNITLGGEQPKFSKKKAKEVYEKFEFIPELIQEALEKDEDFT